MGGIIERDIYVQALFQRKLLEGRAVVPEYMIVSQEGYDTLKEDAKRLNIPVDNIEPHKYMGLIVLVDPTLKGAEVKIK